MKKRKHIIEVLQALLIVAILLLAMLFGFVLGVLIIASFVGIITLMIAMPSKMEFLVKNIMIFVIGATSIIGVRIICTKLIDNIKGGN